MTKKIKSYEELPSISYFFKKSDSGFNEEVERVCGDIAEMLKKKNESYGNSALDPIRVFSKSATKEQLCVRIDDKLSRIKRGNNDFNEDTVKDLIGYLVLLLLSEEV